MPSPPTLLATMQLVSVGATLVCNVINEALQLELELEHETLRALKELRKEVESLKSNTMVYKPLLSAMEKDIDLHESSFYTRFI